MAPAASRTRRLPDSLCAARRQAGRQSQSERHKQPSHHDISLVLWVAAAGDGRNSHDVANRL